jgi:AcrR family transcriptional regulator
MSEVKEAAQLTPPKRTPGRPKDDSLAARRQEEILEVATRIFATDGYQSTDLQEVADVLGVAKGTLYRYFPSKKELFLACVDHGRNRLGEKVLQSLALSTDPLETIAIVIRAFFAFFDEHPELVELIIQERAEFRDRNKHTYFFQCDDKGDDDPWEALISEPIRAGRMRNVPVKRVTDVLSNLVYGTMFSNYFTGRQESLEAQTDDIIDVVFNGLLTERNGDHGNGS